MTFKKSIFILLITFMTSTSYADEWVYPTGNPNSKNVRVTQDYMNHLVEPTLNIDGYHNGVDIGSGIEGDRNHTPNNLTIRAVSRGRVIYVGTGYNGGYGNTVVIRHDFLSSNRYIFSSYNHMRDDSILVERNEVVQAGQPIGTMGTTGRSTFTHLHLNIFTTQNGFSQWNGFVRADMAPGYATNDESGAPYTNGNSTFYDPLLFIKFARLATISPPSIQEYSINNDAGNNAPSTLRVGNNTVDVNVSSFRSSIDLSLNVRNYNNRAAFGGSMTLNNTGNAGWIMSNEYAPLGNDLDNNGWNAEYLHTFRYNFDLDTSSENGADLALFWKPDNYDSSSLILAVPGGNAHNTIRNTGRYVHRTVN